MENSQSRTLSLPSTFWCVTVGCVGYGSSSHHQSIQLTQFSQREPITPVQSTVMVSSLPRKLTSILICGLIYLGKCQSLSYHTMSPPAEKANSALWLNPFSQRRASDERWGKDLNSLPAPPAVLQRRGSKKEKITAANI